MEIAKIATLDIRFIGELPGLPLEPSNNHASGVGCAGPENFGSGSLLILGLYSFIICLVAAVLCVAVNNLEPNRRESTALKILIIGLAGAAILAHLTP